MAGLDAIATERLRGERLGPRHVDVLLPIFADRGWARRWVA